MGTEVRLPVPLAPIASTVPAASAPSIRILGRKSPPAMKRMKKGFALILRSSLELIEEARTLIRISSSAGAGFSTSLKMRTDGDP